MKYLVASGKLLISLLDSNIDYVFVSGCNCMWTCIHASAVTVVFQLRMKLSGKYWNYVANKEQIGAVWRLSVEKHNFGAVQIDLKWKPSKGK